MAGVAGERGGVVAGFLRLVGLPALAALAILAGLALAVVPTSA
jgi:hypothetical protein